ncbi:TetR/AcrR family transcriptional regulator [Zhongshania sp.]|uniref:TetR/AcrR family transcriptional regulator n=1 Tax=Zhongshania sp. TaxID=1971902 RepID=UPI0039E225EA
MSFFVTATGTKIPKQTSRQQAREDSYNRILGAARRVFSEQGFSGTSLDAIAKQATSKVWWCIISVENNSFGKQL